MSAFPASAESFSSEADYRAAIDAVIAAAQCELCIFDRDLGRMRLEDLERSVSLERFLGRNPAVRIRVAVHEPSRLAAASPRLQALLRRYSQSIAFRQTPESLRHLADCLVLADGRHGVVRFHADHARGKVLLNDPDEIVQRQRRFDELWEVSGPCLGAAQTGLSGG